MSELASAGGDDPLIARVAACADSILGDTAAGREIRGLCDRYQDSHRRLTTDRTGGSAVVAVIGPAGQGKSWIVRRFVGDDGVRSRIRSGNHAAGTTERLVWVGPNRPVDLDERFEDHFFVPSERLADLGFDYTLLDVPGATDDRPEVAAVATRALASSSVLILVVRRDQLRTAWVGRLAAATSGSVVVPVFNLVRRRDAALDADVDAAMATLRAAAPHSTMTAPVVIDDFELDDRDEADVGAAAVAEIAARLNDVAAGSAGADRRRRSRLESLRDGFRRELSAILRSHLPALTEAVRRIRRHARSLPGDVASSLVGDDTTLSAAVRSRLRLRLLTETGGLWFPHRTLLSVLNLTGGVWDRLLLSMAGSLPSLITTVHAGVRNLSTDRAAVANLREGLLRRGEDAVAERLGPLSRQFEDEIRRLRGEKPKRSTAGEAVSAPAHLSGLESLQQRSREVFDAAVERHAVSPVAATLAAVVGTALFWALMSGPIVSLYREYLGAGVDVYRSGGGLESFPRPDASLYLTSLLLSLLPALVVAMITMAWAQSRSRVRRCRDDIRRGHDEAIDELRGDGVLRLTWDQPLLADAEFLLSAGEGGGELPDESGELGLAPEHERS